MKNEKIKLVESKLSKCDGLLSFDLKLVDIESRLGTKLLGESFVFKFSNRLRSVQVIFYPQPNNEDYFLVNLVNQENKEIFNIKDWLKKHEMIEPLSPFKLSSYAGSFEERLDLFVAYLGRLFSHDILEQILQGDSWESVDFDWAGMR